MRHRLIARDLVASARASLGLHENVIDEIFDGAPLDFPVVFSLHLPLLADRFGMTGITLLGSVWFVESVRSLPAISLLSLLRHEAEHVRQQRERPVMFYPRYGLAFLRALVEPARGRIGSRFLAAYRRIPYEEEAYRADAVAHRIVLREASRL